MVCSQSNQVVALVVGVVPTIAIILFLVAALLYIGYILAGKKSKKMKLAATVSVFGGAAFIGLAIIAPVVIDALGIGSEVPPVCGLGEETIVDDCRWLCEAPDPLAGQPCDTQNYSLCGYGCVRPRGQDECVMGHPCTLDMGTCSRHSRYDGCANGVVEIRNGTCACAGCAQ